jgi:hypothetical protein
MSKENRRKDQQWFTGQNTYNNTQSKTEPTKTGYRRSSGRVGSSCSTCGTLLVPHVRQSENESYSVMSSTKKRWNLTATNGKYP